MSEGSSNCKKFYINYDNRKEAYNYIANISYYAVKDAYKMYIKKHPEEDEICKNMLDLIYILEKYDIDDTTGIYLTGLSLKNHGLTKENCYTNARKFIENKDFRSEALAHNRNKIVGGEIDDKKERYYNYVDKVIEGFITKRATDNKFTRMLNDYVLDFTNFDDTKNPSEYEYVDVETCYVATPISGWLNLAHTMGIFRFNINNIVYQENFDKE